MLKKCTNKETSVWKNEWMEKQEKGRKKWIRFGCTRNTAFSSILFVNKNTDSLKAAE